MDKKRKRYFTIFIPLILVFIIAAVFFSIGFWGSIKVVYSNQRVTIEGSSSKVTLDYNDIVSVEQRFDFSEGEKIEGKSNFGIKSGTYKNEELGKYQLNIYKKVKQFIIVYYGSTAVVFNCSSNQETSANYRILLQQLDKSKTQM